MDPQTLAKIMELVKAAQKTPIPDALAKGWAQSASATSGLTMYDLEGPAKLLYPVLTPLRNMIPRDFTGMGIQANWRAITGININQVSAGVGFGRRGGEILTSTQDYSASFKALGLEDFVEFEADYASRGFDDVKARAVQGLLNSMMIQEERIILGGNSALALGTTPTPTLAASASGGSIGTITLSVICVALSLEGFLNSVVGPAGIPGQVTRTNMDGTTQTYGGGNAQQSAAATVSVTGPNGSATATVAPVAGAVGYAWFAGTAGNERIAAITTINSVQLTTTSLGTNQLASAIPGGVADRSTNNLVFDGLLTMCSTGALNAYRAVMPTGVAGTGTPLTSDNAGGVVEIDNALKSFWDNYRLSPSMILVHSQEMNNIGKKILAGNSNAAQRFVFQTSQNAIGGGIMVRSYLNKFSMGGATEIPIMLHPNMPPGTIMFLTKDLPYPLSNVSDVFKIKGRRDYHQIEWPLRTRRYEYGVYSDQVLQHYFPPSMGIITNIANG